MWFMAKYERKEYFSHFPLLSERSIDRQSTKTAGNEPGMVLKWPGHVTMFCWCSFNVIYGQIQKKIVFFSHFPLLSERSIDRQSTKTAGNEPGMVLKWPGHVIMFCWSSFNVIYGQIRKKRIFFTFSAFEQEIDWSSKYENCWKWTGYGLKVTRMHNNVLLVYFQCDLWPNTEENSIFFTFSAFKREIDWSSKYENCWKWTGYGLKVTRTCNNVLLV